MLAAPGVSVVTSEVVEVAVGERARAVSLLPLLAHRTSRKIFRPARVEIDRMCIMMGACYSPKGPHP